MNDLDLVLARGRELQQEAARYRLARLATCCKPSALRRQLSRLTARVRPTPAACRA